MIFELRISILGLFRNGRSDGAGVGKQRPYTRTFERLASCGARMARSGVGDCASQPRAWRESQAFTFHGMAPVGIRHVIVY